MLHLRSKQYDKHYHGSCRESGKIVWCSLNKLYAEFKMPVKTMVTIAKVLLTQQRFRLRCSLSQLQFSGCSLSVQNENLRGNFSEVRINDTNLKMMDSAATARNSFMRKTDLWDCFLGDAAYSSQYVSYNPCAMHTIRIVTSS